MKRLQHKKYHRLLQFLSSVVTAMLSSFSFGATCLMHLFIVPKGLEGGISSVHLSFGTD